jgi:hypothetical protein
MRTVAILGTSFVLLFGATALAQHGHQEGDSHGHEGYVRHQEHAREAREQHGNHDARGPEARHEYHESFHRGEEHADHRPAQMHEVRRYEPAPRYVRQDIWQRQRAHDWRSEHRSWHERGGYYGYRIPEDRFRAHFGRGHWFRVHEVPVIVVDRSPRFQFGGYWFGVVDPCPETWSPVWYRTDDVYVDYVNDGYYLYNRQHPGIAIAVDVTL